MKRKLLAAAFLFVPALAAAQPSVAPATTPVAGEMITVKMSGWQWPTYAPATRYVRSGNTFTIDFEYASDFFGPSRPDFWDLPVPLGELPAGNYTVQARMIDTANPNSQPQIITSPLTVGANSTNLRSIPSKPYASQNFEMYVPSQYYFDPASVKLTYEGNIIRVDYSYDPARPVGPMQAGTSGPPGMVSWTRVSVAGVPPGEYWMYAVGSAISGPAHFYVSYEPLQVRTSVEAVEYYAEATDRYFVTSTPSEIMALDGQGYGWKRTGQRFEVWPQAAGAAPGAQPVCRFYAPSQGAHYHTAHAAECAWLRDLETQERSRLAQSGGGAFQGWTYEGAVFHALLPTNGQCAEGTKPVYRGSDGPHHRYASDPAVYGTMAFAWKQEGAAFCTPR